MHEYDHDDNHKQAVRIKTILPGRSDPNQLAKRMIWERAGSEAGAEVLLPPVDATISEFDLEEYKSQVLGCSFAVADLTFERPSCYFELGAVQAMGLPVVFLGALGTPVHQHASGIAVYSYTGLDGYREVVERLVLGVGIEPGPIDG